MTIQNRNFKMIVFFLGAVMISMEFLLATDSEQMKSPPSLGCWFWGDPAYFDAGPNGQAARRAFLTAVDADEAFDTLSTSTRYDIEVTDPLLHALMEDAVSVAREEFGLGILLDLDIRLARRSFEKEFPNDRQESLHFAETSLFEPTLDFFAATLGDHYSSQSIPYYVRNHRLVRVWTYRKSSDGAILSETIHDVTDRAEVTSADENHLRVTLKPAETDSDAEFMTAAVAFGYLYPDVFSPNLIPFEKKILRSYADLPLAGTCKDEWGFPPCFKPEEASNEFWFSPTMADAYFAKTGRDLTDDLFLAWWPQSGKNLSRADRIDDYNRLCYERHVEIETEFTKVNKEVFGERAFSATHPSWWPWPDAHEFKKNNLSWWGVPREVAQTDECVPYCCRNSLAKKTGTVWINMFYASEPTAYLAEHWGALLSGGRVNIHPLYPVRDDDSDSHPSITRMRSILNMGISEARRKIRLVDFLSASPVHSPVAVVFGHFGAMNFARDEWNQVGTKGIALCNELAQRGFPTDLIPSSDFKTWRRDSDGRLRYGVQTYETVIFFDENRSDATDFDALRRLASGDENTLPATQIETIPATASDAEIIALTDKIVMGLAAKNVTPVTNWTRQNFWGDYSVALPPKSGFTRLTDGTEIRAKAEDSGAGDRFILENETIMGEFGTTHLSATVTGLIAFRFDAEGNLTALAAGGLERFSGGGFEWTTEKIGAMLKSIDGLEMSDQNSFPDLAVKQGVDGQWSGVLITKKGERIELSDSLLTETIMTKVLK